MVGSSEYSLELEVEWIRPFIRINIKKLDKNFAPGRTERTINCLQTMLELLGKGLYSLIQIHNKNNLSSMRKIQSSNIEKLIILLRNLWPRYQFPIVEKKMFTKNII